MNRKDFLKVGIVGALGLVLLKKNPIHGSYYQGNMNPPDITAWEVAKGFPRKNTLILGRGFGKTRTSAVYFNNKLNPPRRSFLKRIFNF